MNRMTQEGRAKLEELIARVMKDGQARGIAVGIVNAAGEIQYENYFGYRDAENKLPITRDTIFGTFGKCDKIALETLVFPPPDPPVTPIMIGLFCIVASVFFLCLFYHIFRKFYRMTFQIRLQKTL